MFDDRFEHQEILVLFCIYSFSLKCSQCVSTTHFFEVNYIRVKQSVQDFHIHLFLARFWQNSKSWLKVFTAKILDLHVFERNNLESFHWILSEQEWYVLKQKYNKAERHSQIKYELYFYIFEILQVSCKIFAGFL